MRTFRLIRDLPTFKAGSEFLLDDGLWYTKDAHGNDVVYDFPICAYAQQTLDKFPNILKDWFEEILESPKTVWDLKEGDEWYFINYSINSCYISSTNNLCCIKAFREMGNVFLTREAAEKELARRKAKVILELDTKGFKPEWGEHGQNKTLVYYDSGNRRLQVIPWSVNAFGGIYFNNQEDAEESIKNHRKEWLTYLGVEEDD